MLRLSGGLLHSRELEIEIQTFIDQLNSETVHGSDLWGLLAKTKQCSLISGTERDINQRKSSGHPAGQTGVYWLVNLVGRFRKIDRKGLLAGRCAAAKATWLWIIRISSEESSTYEQQHFLCEEGNNRSAPLLSETLQNEKHAWKKWDRIKIQGMVGIQNEIGTRYECA